MSANVVPSLRDLPKAHLHVHLEGAMRPTTLDELATRYGAPVPVVQKRFGTFADFQDLYVTAVGLLRSFDDLRRLVTEVVEDAAADGAVWIEPAVHLPDHAQLGPSDQVLDVLVSAGLAAQEATGVGVGWLITADRTLSPELAVVQAEVASRNSDRGVVAFGLANHEPAAPPEHFAEAFAVARAAGLIAAPHAGEHGGPDSVLGAAETLGADRIQHGVRAIEDESVITRLADGRVCLDVCPTSNVALSVVADFCDHPLSSLLERGVPCSINADDPLLFGVGLLDEYRLCRDTLELDTNALAGCARASIEHSGAPTGLKTRSQRAIDRWQAGASPPTH
jgi:adenosine deaminase